MKKILEFRNKHYSQEEAQFNFNSLNYKIDGTVFIICAFVVPFAFSLFFRIFLNLKTNTTSQEIFFYINILSNIFGLVIFILRNPKKILTKGYSLFYFFALLPSLTYIIIGTVSNSLIKDSENKQTINIFIQMICQILSEVIIISIAFFFDRNLWLRIKNTFKKSIWTLLITGVVGFILLYLISSLFFSMLIEDNLLKLPQSENENSLKSVLQGNSSVLVKVSYGVLLSILSIIVAPVCEELCMRESYFSNSSNQYLGFIFSGLSFGFIHYGSTGDFEHIMTYTTAGFVLSGVFWFSKGNVTYSWLVHLINNLFALILTFALL
ncbi:CAAX amino terminal membrane bound protease [Spiroplasma litorale]|uniref:CAAX amino terminal membrane bound protease n=1 Tax=Spiroplasma litorale TaxID=216942 RepID=A0A0K1W0E6_9MOLU|nr:CPBP family intramembrane glutamic endopeptidase [Spiroplasma litorale]AKX33769.1 CAAX amino terminal membrane bound protease [Spiroplasma litorale]